MTDLEFTEREIEKVNTSFNRQIYRESRVRYDLLTKSELDKELFNASLRLSPKDWRTIRTDKYWAKRDSLETDYEKKAYLLLCIEYYFEKILKIA